MRQICGLIIIALSLSLPPLGTGCSSPSGPPPTSPTTAGLDERVRYFAERWRRATTATERRAVCVAIIDDGLLKYDRDLAQVQAVFGDDFWITEQYDNGVGSGWVLSASPRSLDTDDWLIGKWKLIVTFTNWWGEEAKQRRSVASYHLTNSSGQETLPATLPSTDGEDERARDFAERWREARIAAVRRTVCMAVIDDGLLVCGRDLAKVRSVFGNDFQFTEENADGSGSGRVDCVPPWLQDKGGWFIGEWKLVINFSGWQGAGAARWRGVIRYHLAHFSY